MKRLVKVALFWILVIVVFLLVIRIGATLLVIHVFADKEISVAGVIGHATNCDPLVKIHKRRRFIFLPHALEQFHMGRP